MFTFKQNRIIQQRINDYLETARQTIDHFSSSIALYVVEGISGPFIESINITFKLESKADDLRREIESELYRKSLLPELRKDILMLIDKTDHLPNKVESILRAIYCQNLQLPPELLTPLKELTAVGVETTHLVFELIKDTLGPCTDIHSSLSQIDTNESKADKIEDETIYKIFRSDYSDMHKLLYRDLLANLSNICDLCLMICDTVTLVNIKRTL